MKIKSFTYEDKSRHWRLNSVEFSDLTLLVGASGVGKTQILRAIYNVSRIAQGDSLNGVRWEIKLEIAPNICTTWVGEFENLDNESDTSIDPLFVTQPKIIHESIVYDGKEIVRRDADDIYFMNKPTPKLNQNESVLKLITDESLSQDKNVLVLITDESLNFLEKTFKLITFNVHTDIFHFDFLWERRLEKRLERYPDLQSIRNSDETMWRRFYLCSLVDMEVFNGIKQSVIEVFPFVEDIRFQLDDKSKIETTAHSSPLPELIHLQIKEKNVDYWIDERQISSGMHRTLMQISELYLCADGTVFLIDEFENSLGINCIDDLTSALMTYERNLQFIITSHHPYIINNISYKNWKIVTRNGGVVTAKDAADYNLGKSKHQAFTQLINLDAYSEGIAE